MSANSANPNGLGGRLNLSLSRWKDKAGAVLDPMKELVERTACLVIGMSEEIEVRQQDCDELATKLAWVMEQVLQKLPFDSGGDRASEATARTVLEALTTKASDIDNFLRSRPSKAQELMSTRRAETIAKFVKDLDEMRLKFVEVRITSVSHQVAGLHCSSMAAKHPEIPSKPAVFFGRDELVATIVQLLLRVQACRIPLLGTGGIGKTSVAVTALNNDAVRAKYGRDILFCCCDSTPTADGIIQKLAEALGLQYNLDARSGLFHYLRSRRFFLLVLDNLETAAYSEDGEHVHQLLAEFTHLPGLSLIITMRGDLPPVGVEWEEIDALDTLSLDAARHIWTKVARKTDKKLDELLGRLDGLPLAIRLMAHQGKYFTPTQLLVSYEKSATKVMKIGIGGRLGSLEVSIELSLGSKIVLEEPCARKLLTLMCLLPDGATIEALQEMLPSMNDDVLPAASALQQVALAFDHNGRLKVLSPIRDVILVRIPPNGRSLDELRDYFVGLCSRADDVGTVNGKESIQPLSAEFGNINSVLVHFWKAPPDGSIIPQLFAATLQVAEFSQMSHSGDVTTLLAEAHRRLDMMQHRHEAADCRRRLGNVLHSRCRYAEAVIMLQEGKLAFEAIGEALGAGQCTQSLGEVFRMQSRYAEAVPMLEEAKLAFEAINQAHGAAQCTQSLGDVLRMQSRYAEAVAMLEEAKLAFQAMNEPLGAVQCTQSLGEVLRIQSRYTEAVPMLEEAKLAFKAIGAPLGAAQCTHSLGEVLCEQSQFVEAVAMLEEAKLAFHAIGEAGGMAQCMHSQGEVLRMQFRYAEAVPMLEEAKLAFEAINHALGAAQCTRSLGDVLRVQYRYAEAVPMLEEAKLAFEAINHAHGAAQCTQSLGDVLRMQSRYAEAVAMLEEARLAFEAMNEPRGAAQCTQTLGDVLCEQSRFAEAVPLLEEAKLAFEAIGEPRGAAQCTQRLGDVLCEQSRFAEAVPMLEVAKLAFEAIGEPRGAAQCMHSLGEVLRVQSRFAEAVVMLEEAKLALQEVGAPLGAAQCTKSLGCIMLRQDRWEEGILLLEQAEAEFLATRDRAELAGCTKLLGIILRSRQRFEEARSKVRRAKDVYEELGSLKDVEDCAKILAALPAEALE
ncbi:TPR-like protein [Calocera viscosa TUFC12733]|uniref:TPR-like protein n=1 Tax=Calocera viscosa (strain TUFC12733) TaxID=1330018 RepID=A0A167HBB3_CALVF|nr:TPR-like protein [Calocera viscosa TUFC12733]